MRAGSRVLLVLVPVCALVACNRPVPAPKAQTVSRLKNVYYTMRLLQEDSRLGIVEQLQGVTNAVTLQNKWVQWMIEATNQSGIDTNAAREQFCHDGYGRLFNVELRTNLIAQGASRSLTNIDFPVVVWSSGFNALDERGFGDDIFLSEDMQPGVRHRDNQETNALPSRSNRPGKGAQSGHGLTTMRAQLGNPQNCGFSRASHVDSSNSY
jgi:hypothetical protein